jgi:uncharacterized protein (TIGR03118 family)
MSMKFVRNMAIGTVVGTMVACGGDGVSLRPSSAYTLSPLVSDGWIAAAFTDTHLRDPRGLVRLPTGAMWVANNLDHSATSYDGTGVPQSQVVNLAVTGSAGDVTGIVANSSDTDFQISSGMVSAPADLVFATGSGTLLGWSPDVDAANAVTVYSDAGGAQYTGLAIATAGAAPQLYAADFNNGRIDIFDSTFAKLDGTGKFEDATLPAGYAPYNIQAVQRQGTTVLAVAYALRDSVSGNVVLGAGNGAVNLYNAAGALVTHLVSAGGRLNAPWGMTVAPPSFGTLGGGLLVGSTGDGLIKGFSILNGAYLNTLTDASDAPVAVNGLWGLAFGNGSSNQPTRVLYVTAGSNNGANGLYARMDLGTQAPDIVAPDSVAVTTPVGASTVSGTIGVAANANDNVGVVRVLFSVEVGGTTSEIGTANSAPFGIDWNTGTVPNGPAALMATAFDAYGNATTSASVMVNVDNVADMAPPTVSLTTPAAGDVIGSVTVSATADDDIGVASVEFFAGTTSLGVDTTAPYSVVWDTTSFTGPQNLTAVATDGAGNMTTSAVVQVTVVAGTVTLAQLQTDIFTPLCASCHNGTSTDTLTHAMNLTSANTSYSSMVGVASDQVGLQRVQEGNPASSYLVRKLEGSQSSGDRMPTNGPYLDQATIDRVRSWIQAGALP